MSEKRYLTIEHHAMLSTIFQAIVLPSWPMEKSSAVVHRCTWRRNTALVITWWWWKINNAILWMSTMSSWNTFLLLNWKATLVWFWFNTFFVVVVCRLVCRRFWLIDWYVSRHSEEIYFPLKQSWMFNFLGAERVNVLIHSFFRLPIFTANPFILLCIHCYNWFIC